MDLPTFFFQESQDCPTILLCDGPSTDFVQDIAAQSEAIDLMVPRPRTLQGQRQAVDGAFGLQSFNLDFKYPAQMLQHQQVGRQLYLQGVPQHHQQDARQHNRQSYIEAMGTHLQQKLPHVAKQDEEIQLLLHRNQQLLLQLEQLRQMSDSCTRHSYQTPEMPTASARRIQSHILEQNPSCAIHNLIPMKRTWDIAEGDVCPSLQTSVKRFRGLTLLQEYQILEPGYIKPEIIGLASIQESLPSVGTRPSTSTTCVEGSMIL
ncbi:hypothetical protein B0O80DRAFT_432793 [Mortierella sp. GBAus27b]|nr:hypothetical protein B0O80DRAFT_432793 [Mortierella sp. GBAus27b]